MHQALLIGEIQLCIFKEVLEKRTLYALATTCQTFTEAALDIYGLKTSHPWRGLEDSTFTLRRSITLSDWAIFQKYSRRVHTVALADVKPDNACILALCSPPTPTPLLPNLTGLNWLVESDAQVFLLRRLFTPSLTSLQLDFSSPRYQPSQGLEVVSQISFESCPSLKFLLVMAAWRSPSPPILFEGIRRSINWLQSLEAIRWGTIESETIMFFARLPALTDATFDLPSNFSTYIETLPSRSPMQKPAFSRVRTLEISSYSLTSVTAFLNHFDVRLEKLNMTLSSRSSRSSSSTTIVQDLSAALGSSSSRNTLRSLTGWHRSPQEFDLLAICEIGPLLQFHRLESLDLELQCPFIINDTTLLAISNTWPNISTLNQLHWPLAVRPLEYLSLPVDFSSIDSDDFDPLSSSGYRAHNTGSVARLRKLYLGPFIITHSSAVAKFLATVLPGRAEITMRWDDDLDDDTAFETGWSLTEKIYCEIRDAVQTGST
ncbi:hypothetical protein BJ138DRAFT_1112961 [Hygrophoropsis aurantiaca]|uniref:Uncharacterized protein n=1 Tax=Hygrophoropsis aurantiaca TaxID=72124 RepID=A0ACB8AG56_9AGAM|nr:hypothetical protein BJ138DRAFT_1112961 [Hygrophoropsis aurantiaca]